MFIYLLIEIDVLRTRSGQSYLLLANENAHLTTHEPIKICVIKVKLKLKFVASVSDPVNQIGEVVAGNSNRNSTFLR